jgi:N6-adenosine-specific RNA methylase IME4
MTDWFFDPLMPLYYEMIVIDPPWGFDLYSKEGAKKSALAKYELMRDRDILDLPVGGLASMNCLLYCWATAPQLPLAIECVKAWGFEYKSLLVWRKTTPSGKIRMGTGYRFRTTGEVVVVATLGNPKQAHIPQTVFDGIAREHSRKPEEFYDICDRVMPHARRADVFARQQRPGWDSFGNEITKFGEAA